MFDGGFNLRNKTFKTFRAGESLGHVAIVKDADAELWVVRSEAVNVAANMLSFSDEKTVI